MSQREAEHLRVLIANERKDRLALVAPIVAALGHGVIAREIEVEDVGAVTARERPDVALVGLGESSEHALQLVEKIVHEAACPVIALIHAPDPDFVKEASKRGVFAYMTNADTTDWQSSIDIVLRRFTEYHDLEGAFGRRAVTERAKGILMERHSIDEPTAFEMLREHARSTNRKLVDVASAVVDGHRLLPKQPRARPPRLTGRADRAKRRPRRSAAPRSSTSRSTAYGAVSPRSPRPRRVRTRRRRCRLGRAHGLAAGRER
jgi:response regulator NasT